MKVCIESAHRETLSITPKIRKNHPRIHLQRRFTHFKKSIKVDICDSVLSGGSCGEQA